jgi:hypothetical protein
MGFPFRSKASDQKAQVLAHHCVALDMEQVTEAVRRGIGEQ